MEKLNVDELIKEINYYAKKSKTEGLTEEEVVIRDELRQKYLKWFRERTRQTLDNIDFEVVEDAK